MASPITGFIYLYDTPFGNGQDWELVVVAPNSGGNAEFSIDNGATWFQCNQGYDATYQGYRYRPASFGSFPTHLFIAPSQVVQARIVGQTDVTKGVLGHVKENANGDGFSYAYGATCSGTNININFCCQYERQPVGNYQLFSADTNRIGLSVNGTPLSGLIVWQDGAPIGTPHFSKIFNTLTVPAASFPLSLVFSDLTPGAANGQNNASTAQTWNNSLGIGAIGDPCVNASNTTTTTTTATPASITSFDSNLGSIQQGVSGNDINLPSPTLTGGCTFTSYQLVSLPPVGISLKKNGVVLTLLDTWTNSDLIILEAAGNATIGSYTFNYKSNGSCGSDEAVLSLQVTTGTTTTTTTTTTVQQTINAVDFTVGTILQGNSSPDIMFPSPILSGGCTFGGNYTFGGGLPSGATLLIDGVAATIGTVITNASTVVIQVSNSVTSGNYSFTYNAIGNCGSDSALCGFTVGTATTTTTTTTTTTAAPTTTTTTTTTANGNVPIGVNLSVTVVQGSSVAIPVVCTVGTPCGITGIKITQGIGCGVFKIGTNSYIPSLNAIIPSPLSGMTFESAGCQPNVYVVKYKCQSDACPEGLENTITITVVAPTTTTANSGCNVCQQLAIILDEVLCIKEEVNAIKCKISNLRTPIHV